MYYETRILDVLRFDRTDVPRLIAATTDVGQVDLAWAGETADPDSSATDHEFYDLLRSTLGVRIMSDPSVPVVLLEVIEDPRNQGPAIADAVCSVFGCVSLDSLRERCLQELTAPNLRRWGMVLGGRWTPTDVELVESALGSDDLECRVAGAEAIALSPAIALRALLSTALERELDDGALRVMTWALQQLGD
ncbi:hypothetical protein ENSA5_64630 [Enhygromyxa salina]|uniref:Uncharacterized protein n=1 Tax=Enhygromyxa salina TaxID=215803 RepID=A0A2S9XC68_9BACT|nr:hypothetical protein [Enhygromyxa salina]PRP90449.1 hypothetical protein ENSA5_64630 [Enhygromyxa salina]